ncbi:membrane-associated phosphatidylinositol transfer protein 2-like isoform X2 [Ptychodera flava]|uniref:membrane-associated phosphatidylinositol transfer protein 2-like isoform X2 n=1 Tax=Ptychodera flava TaxID=63121 RepID=UPI003969EE3A
MITKEYRIALPMSVEEYRIAQLYMIQKKSREESQGEGSGVEILQNKPYTNGPGGAGQYTYKVYHIGNHLPGWFRAILPKSALRVEEEAWNAYPYTKTRYTCPFVEKFSLEIETKYLPDPGTTENAFELSSTELRSRTLDRLDIVKDGVSTSEYKREEDPKYYISKKTGRGPLNEEWLKEYTETFTRRPSDKKIMCSYKLCRVEFRYWGMQNKIERFIHDVALRKTMVRAHRQAWCWQDEWSGLDISDIRKLEKEAQKELAEKMADTEEITRDEDSPPPPANIVDIESLGSASEDSPIATEPTIETGIAPTGKRKLSGRLSADSHSSAVATLSEWRMNSIVRDTDSSDDEFYDAQEDVNVNIQAGLTKWSSEELLMREMSETSIDEGEMGSPAMYGKNRVTSLRQTSMEMSAPASPTLRHEHHQCNIHWLFLILHGGNILDGGQDINSKHIDLNTFSAALDAVVRAHFPAAHGRVVVKLVNCPATCTESLNILTSISPYSYDTKSPLNDNCQSTGCGDFLPLGALPVMATTNPEYVDIISTVINRANSVFNEFMRSEEGLGFNGQVCLIGDSMGAILGYDALCRPLLASRRGSQMSVVESESSETHQEEHLQGSHGMSLSSGDLHQLDSDSTPQNGESMKRSPISVSPFQRESSFTFGQRGHQQLTCTRSNESRRTSTASQYPPDNHLLRFDFEVSDFFMFGSPLALVLAYRKMLHSDDRTSGAPLQACCSQVYNLFHRTDPSASRLEPLLNTKFTLLPPSTVPRYQKFPLGDGHSINIADIVSSNSFLFGEGSGGTLQRHPSLGSISTTDVLANSSQLSNIISKWWGTKRLDYALYCPEALQAFPTGALPHLFHASYWESTDVIAFILRQIMHHDTVSVNLGEEQQMSAFTPIQPREKWQRRRTNVKLKNVSPNHRSNDVIITEDLPQTLSARFMYGPLDMVTLTGEKVDIHIMTQPPSGEWVYFDTVTTSNHGRTSYTIPESRRLGHGLYPVKMVVRGDHTSADSYLLVLPPRTEAVAFSIDGSFTASVSIMGKDPKVRAGAVDVVRHWQELGYLILYVTGRPDMQKQKVLEWLAQHNFPHGMVNFCDGLSADPLRQKANYLRNLMQDTKLVIHAAYGSNKDVNVYSSIGLQSHQIFIVGKASKKNHSLAQVLSEGYAAHLNILARSSRPAVGNSRMVLRKGCFSLPGQCQVVKVPTKQPARRVASYQGTITSGQGHSLAPARSFTQHRSPTTHRASTSGVKFETGV